mmetsp:Transcript_29530/g.47479  ORF Transcript_29530/g.47479 Transcript_29530/m.47479 type:complete len:323 (-) Transcript_29530:347-1315(-)
MPWMGVKARLEDMPLVAPPLAPYFANVCWSFLPNRSLVALAATLSLPLAAAAPADVPRVPMPSPVNPNSSSATLNPTRFADFLISLFPKRSFIARWRLPPRLFFASPPGMGRGLLVLAGGGSCHFSIFWSTSACILRPISPVGSCPNASTRAMSVHLPPTSRAARVRRGGGVLRWMVSHWKINPACRSPALTAAALEKPAVVFRLAPSTCTLHAGILDSATNPPATPMSRAATSGPSTAERFGAVRSMRSSTRVTSLRLSASSCMARSHAAKVVSRSSGDSGWPFVVEPVTDTTMIVAEGSTPSSSTNVMSISLPIALMTRA